MQQESPRRLHALVMGMPDDAAWRKASEFSLQEELTAGLLERVDAWGRAQVEMAATGKTQTPGPVQILRPGQEAAEEADRPKSTAGRKVVSLAEFAARTERVGKQYGDDYGA